MFTGIIEETGTIQAMPGAGRAGELIIGCRKVLENTKVGDSIAVNGICLTVTRLMAGGFSADVMPETIRRSSLSQKQTGDAVNLERALSLSRRLGGHIVTGHIDGTGTVLSVRQEENAIWYTIELPPNLQPYIVEKGSIAIDGISLTVAEVKDEPMPQFAVSIIPHTWSETTLRLRKPHDIVNLETDLLGKYVNRVLSLNKAGEPDPALKNNGSNEEWTSLLKLL